VLIQNATWIWSIQIYNDPFLTDLGQKSPVVLWSTDTIIYRHPATRFLTILLTLSSEHNQFVPRRSIVNNLPSCNAFSRVRGIKFYNPICFYMLSPFLKKSLVKQEFLRTMCVHNVFNILTWKNNQSVVWPLKGVPRNVLVFFNAEQTKLNIFFLRNMLIQNI